MVVWNLDVVSSREVVISQYDSRVGLKSPRLEYHRFTRCWRPSRYDMFITLELVLDPRNRPTSSSKKSRNSRTGPVAHSL
jgi:hypothetical protein